MLELQCTESLVRALGTLIAGLEQKKLINLSPHMLKSSSSVSEA